MRMTERSSLQSKMYHESKAVETLSFLRCMLYWQGRGKRWNKDNMFVRNADVMSLSVISFRLPAETLPSCLMCRIKSLLPSAANTADIRNYTALKQEWA